MYNKVIEKLILEKKGFKDIVIFSSKPGLYALFFTGKDFLIDDCNPLADEIIYIGKTEKSQKSRDLNTHFQSGRTGSSTLRRTVGALLRKRNNLIPIQRNTTDYARNRRSHYKFDSKSEELITEWMVNNLGLSFFEFVGTPSELDILESHVIKAISPVFNIDRKNTLNPYRKYILEMRKNCANEAFAGSVNLNLHTQLRQTQNNNAIGRDLGSVGKYYNLWRSVIARLLEDHESFQVLKITLNQSDFEEVGNRKSYSFNLETIDGIETNNISGSAVARDLLKAINDSGHNKVKLNKGKFRFQMGKDFHLKISRV